MKRVRLASLLLLLLNGWWWTSPWIWETADLVDLQTKRDNGAGRHGRAMAETFQIVAGNVDLTKKYHAFERIYFLVELCFRDVICDFIIWKSDLIIVDQDDVDEWSEPFAWWCRKLSPVQNDNDFEILRQTVSQNIKNIYWYEYQQRWLHHTVEKWKIYSHQNFFPVKSTL